MIILDSRQDILAQTSTSIYIYYIFRGWWIKPCPSVNIKM